MKRVICLYRVSTVGQVDHDDIPMQKLACREYAKTHPDWEIVDEISEKGVSGYKVSTNARDAIVEIKRRAAQHQFDVLLVFMFDRLGRREDETPFVVQWFVQQGIEVWSTKEGEQRFDTHVDKLLNYIRFWQASGESEKTAIRVRTKHEQMVMDGLWRGGLVPYGYRLEFLGRTNKKNQPVRDLVIDEKEAAVIREIYQLITEKGYGTNRVANHLNEQGIKTKRGTTLWRGTSIRAIIDNPVYKGILRFGDERSEPFENLRIVSDEVFDRCLELVKGRACKGEYSDKTKKVREYFFEDDRADFFLKMLREMIPSFEKMPVLLEEEDEDDDIVREKIEDAQDIADALLNSPRYDFSNLVPSKLENGLAVVYAIFDKQDDSTLYVGRTKNLRQRLYNNHLMGPKSNARLKKYLTEDPERPDIPTMEAAKQYLIDNCYFQYIPEPDIRKRGQIEGLLGYLLNVRYIHEEH